MIQTDNIYEAIKYYLFNDELDFESKLRYVLSADIDSNIRIRLLQTAIIPIIVDAMLSEDPELLELSKQLILIFSKLKEKTELNNVKHILQ